MPNAGFFHQRYLSSVVDVEL